RDVSAEAVARAHLDRIAETDGRIDAFLLVAADRALEKARRVDADIAAGGAPPPLAGVPVAVKDLLDIEGLPTTCGSRILDGYRPPFTATAVARLEAAGAVVLGQTNLDQVGPFARSVEDVARMTEVLCGWDPMDATSARMEVPRLASGLDGSARGLRVGVPWRFLAAGVDEGIMAAFRSAIDALQAAGAEVVD